MWLVGIALVVVLLVVGVVYVASMLGRPGLMVYVGSSMRLPMERSQMSMSVRWAWEVLSRSRLMNQ